MKVVVIEQGTVAWMAWKLPLSTTAGRSRNVFSCTLWVFLGREAGADALASLAQVTVSQRSLHEPARTDREVSPEFCHSRFLSEFWNCMSSQPCMASNRPVPRAAMEVHSLATAN